MKYVARYDTVYGIVRLFDLDSEHGIPAFFSASLLVFASLLLAVIAVLKKRSRAPYARQWALLSCAFLYMAFDEAAGIHELLMRPTQELLGARPSGFFYFAWVIPGILVTVVFALWFFRFFLHLPAQTRRIVLAAAVLFIGGAIGVELFEGRHAQLHGAANIAFGLWVLLEETLEMAGVALFVYAMLRYIEDNYAEVGFRVTRPEDSSK